MAESLDSWKKHLTALNEIQSLKVNYNPQTFTDSHNRLGWAVDNHRGHLAFEPPGAPIPNGPFERAKTIIFFYRFPDPKIVKGFFDPNAPLLGRNMLLEAYFLGFTFHFATRVTSVYDEQRTNAIGNLSQVWGYSYQTLEGHFEEGQMSFEVWKDLSSGEVSFHIDAYSKFARIGNPFYRIGFHLFKRPLQRKYISRAILRMQELTAQA